MTTDESAEAGEAQWAFVLDPAWRPETDEQNAPLEAVLGAWYLEPDGTTGPFRANPYYLPTRENSPTDPVDAALQLLIDGAYDGDELLAVMRDALFGIALDEQGSAVVAPSPDDVPSVLVATSPVHAHRVEVAAWQEITAKDLADSLPGEGVDVLLNPGAPASMRVLASSLKGAVADVESGARIPGGNPFEPPEQD